MSAPPMIDWLRYANQGATRNKPLQPELVQALSFLPQLGVTMEVFSGGQDAKGEGDRRTGSTRHDHGAAADAFFYKDGRKLDWANPEDQPIFAQIVQRAKAAGITGIGAGDGYMRPGSMHIGFGSSSVWGAGGKGSNAASWLVDAYNGAPQGKTPVNSGGADAGQANNQAPIERNPLRLAWARRTGKMTPEDAALYDRGVEQGRFKPPAQQSDPLAIYQQVAQRQQRPMSAVPLQNIAMPAKWPGLGG